MTLYRYNHFISRYGGDVEVNSPYRAKMANVKARLVTDKVLNRGGFVMNYLAFGRLANE
jgi:hypothetical protein